MTESMDLLEERIDGLRAEVRRALIAGARDKAIRLRRQLREAEAAWDTAVIEAVGDDPIQLEPVVEAEPEATLLTIKDQVHQALTFLTVPAGPKLIVAVHGALFGGRLVSTQLASVRRDEERSFKIRGFDKPYYLCAALTTDRLAPARGLTAVSTWPLAARMVGPLSPRVDFLTAAIRVAEYLGDPERDTLPARRLLWQFAANIPGGSPSFDTMQPSVVARAAAAELDVHKELDRDHRKAAASRARDQLEDVQQLFGATLDLASRAARTT